MRAVLPLLLPLTGFAHEGHGAAAPAHLHPGEVMGLVALAAVVAIALVHVFWKK